MQALKEKKRLWVVPFSYADGNTDNLKTQRLQFHVFVSRLILKNLKFVTYSHRVLHVSHGGAELAEVHLRAVNQRVGKIAAAAACTHTRKLPLLAIGHHSGVELPCGDSLKNRNKEKRVDSDNTCCKDVFCVSLMSSGIDRKRKIHPLSLYVSTRILAALVLTAPTCAPVSVAISRIMSADRSLQAYTTPSASTSLPSASVLLISTVLKNESTHFIQDSTYLVL